MEQFKKFLEKYIEEEHKLYIAGLSETNVDLFLEKYKNFENKYYEYGIVNYNISTPREPFKKYYARGKKIIEDSIPRIIFQIKTYEHSDFEIVFRCYLSRTSPPKQMPRNYYENFFVVKKDNDYKIISIYTIKIGLKKISTDLKDWEYSRGKEMVRLGKTLDIMKFQPPEDPVQLEEYKAE